MLAHLKTHNPLATVLKRPEGIETIRTVLIPPGQLKLSGQNLNRPDSIETVRTELKPSGQN